MVLPALPRVVVPLEGNGVVVIAGIDPGLSGAVALLCTGMGAIDAVWDMPTLVIQRGGKSKRDLDAHGLSGIIRSAAIDHAFVEQVGAMPGQGVSAVFSFGKSFGVLIGVLAALDVPITLVSPVAWKRRLRVPASKDGARARASQLLPAASVHWPLAKHDGRAEAALIALYGVGEQVPRTRFARRA